MFDWKGKKKKVCYVGSMNIGFVTSYNEGKTFSWFTRLNHPEMDQWRPDEEKELDAIKNVEDSFKHWLKDIKPMLEMGEEE